jgi:N-terminal C2 in EEIG1 and EHBP1 proteins
LLTLIQIIDLINVPLVSGACYVKWHLPSSTAAEHRGRTEKVPIKEHRVMWNYEKAIAVRLTMDKTNLLQECTVNFEVVQDYSAAVRGEKITLGHVSLNLAEYVDVLGDDGDEGITGRYLMQESKLNSTLKVGISMRQMDGERNYISPPLKTAPVFGGIAGIVDFDQVEHDDLGRMHPRCTTTRRLLWTN